MRQTKIRPNYVVIICVFLLVTTGLVFIYSASNYSAQKDFGNPYYFVTKQFVGAVIGAVLGFLWFNAKPASIFMGDVGSLALGGFMGTVAMLLKSEIIMGVAAGMMVLILLSSFIQTMMFKITRKITGTGRRVFLRAPIHHHFEELGWPETKIVDRFFIISILFSGLALVLLKFA